MAIYLDSATKEEITGVRDFPFIAGVTCNPLLVSKAMGKNRVSGKEFFDFIGDLAEVVSGKFFVQTNFFTSNEIVRESIEIHELFPGKLVIKIPFSLDGLKAIPKLKERGIQTAITAVFSVSQMLFSAESGADYVIPFCHRLSQRGESGTEIVGKMITVKNSCPFSARILAASIRTTLEFNELAAAGVQDLTISHSLLTELMEHALDIEMRGSFRSALSIE